MAKGIVFFAFVLALSVTVRGQSDSTIYHNGLPVSDDDTVRNFPPTDYYPKNVAVPMAATQLPHRVLKSLQRESIYSGWEKLPVLFDKNTGIYTVRIKAENDTIYYGLNENGKPVSYGKKNKDDQ